MEGRGLKEEGEEAVVEGKEEGLGVREEERREEEEEEERRVEEELEELLPPAPPPEPPTPLLFCPFNPSVATKYFSNLYKITAAK